MCYEVNTQNYLIRTQFSKCIWEADEHLTREVQSKHCVYRSELLFWQLCPCLAHCSHFINHPQTNTESPLLSISDQSELPRIHLFAGIFLILIKRHHRWFTEYTLLVDSAAICLESTTYWSSAALSTWNGSYTGQCNNRLIDTQD